MIHPDINETNVLLFKERDRETFLKAIELMVIFNLKIKIQDESLSIAEQ